MNYILTVVSVLFGTCKNITSKLGKNYFSEVNSCARLNAVTSVIAAVVFGVTAGNWSMDYSAVLFNALKITALSGSVAAIILTALG